MKPKNTVSGKVVSVEFGKDSCTAWINTDKNEIYFATISNVEEIWKTDTENHIKVKEIVSVK
jgi:hypothetical protein